MGFLVAASGSGPEDEPADSAGTESPGVDETREQLDEILSDPAFAGTEIGVEAIACESGEVVHSKNPDVLLNPASNLKILTSAVGLEILGPAYVFRTSVLHDGKFEDGVVHGNLYIRGEGDPQLVFEGAWKFVKNLQARGLKVVEGDLVADDSFFDGRRMIPDWDRASRDDEAFAYDATIGALSVNFNAVAIYVQPGARVGEPVRVSLETPTDYVRIASTATTSRKHSRLSLKFSRGAPGPDHETLALEGKLPMGIPGVRYYRTVRNPTRFALAVFSELMEHEGIELKGRVRAGRVPEGAEAILHHYSEPLGILIRYMNKLSSNFIAEQLLKTLGAEVFGAPGTTEKGLRVLRDYLAREGLPWESSLLFNGSGLSEHSRVSAHQLTALLCRIWQDFRIRPDFVASLPIAGVDGTLRRRMQATPAAGILRAKTGSVRSVFGFSGFLPVDGGDVVAFAFLVNGLQTGVRPIKEAQDRWANAIVSGNFHQAGGTGKVSAD